MTRIAKCGIVPVIVLNDAKKAVPLAQALLAGGIDVMEITFRTAAARESIEAVSREVPEILVGAGTVLNKKQMDEAIGAGAKFLVSPGSDSELIQAAAAAGCPLLPGAVTPSEIMAGLKLGVKVFKFFPAENYGGLATLKSLGAPFADISFVPTGGISDKNIRPYLENKRVMAVGGSWMAPAALVDAGDFVAIEQLTRDAVKLLRSIRG
ncbi:MAG: bifunctional 4-hydroxy-2-oxoglutarate aldolase/2-dehydro-3-deoxy-phosphogluconate aldolase [Clostridiaceae bacterium]|nr:bifunctional 4-hydroxy-2-oxoglutarate aldolase/2-dehydro-3-deoxy-phosphogluconate aldolase [Clostridiaceae bacterium]